MKKMNNKGFLMVEALIVSTFVVSVLIYFFVQFKKVDASFELSYSYNTVNGLYAVNNISSYLDNLYENNSTFKNIIDNDIISHTENPSIIYKVLYDDGENNEDYLTCDTYCSKLMQSLNVKKAILASGDLNYLIANTDNDTFFTEKMRNFIKQEITREFYISDYKILVQFKDDTFASTDKIFENFYITPQIFVRSANATTNSLTISYALANIDDESGVTITCKYGTEENNLVNDSNVSINTNNKTCTINNLNSDTLYYYSLSVSVEGQEYETGILSKKTSKLLPGIIVNNVEATTTTLTLSYELENTGDGAIVGCVYGEDSNNLQSNNVSINTNNKTCTISNLNVNTNYHYSLSVTYDGDTTDTSGNKKTSALTSEDAPQSFSGVLKVVYLDPTDLTKQCNSNLYNATTNPNGYNSTTNTKSGCMRWYAYNDDGTNYKMILDHNTTASLALSNTSANVSTKQSEILARLNFDTKDNPDNPWQVDANDSNKIKDVSVIDANEIAVITGKNWNSSTTTNWFWFEGTGTNYQTKPSSANSNSIYAWLYNNTYNCINYGCTEKDDNTYDTYKLSNATTNTFTKTGESTALCGYWTKSLYSTSGLWTVFMNGAVDDDYNGTRARRGIRPVITIPSTWLE